MTFEELVDAASRAKVDEANVAAIKQSLKEAVANYQDMSRKREMTEEALSLTCSL